MTNQQQKAIAPSSTGGDRLNQPTYSLNSSGSGKYQRSGQGHPCPVCGRTKDADCAWNDEIVLCHTERDLDAQVDGYVYRGIDKTDTWGQYFPTAPSNPKPVRQKNKKEFFYNDVNRQKLVKVTRKDDGKGKKRIFQSHWNGRDWINKVPDEVKAKIRLYRIKHYANQDAIKDGKPILIVEGEGKVDLLLKLGIPATCSIGGAGKWQHYGYPNYLEDLEGAKLVLCPDRDIPGLKHCEDIEQDFPDVQWLYAFPESAVWNNLPENGGLDIVDWVEQDKVTAEQILAAIAPKRDIRISQPAPKDEPDESAEPDRQTIAQLMLAIAEQGRYFHTSADKAYVDIYIEQIRHTFPVRSRRFKQWLSRELYIQHQKMAGSESLNQVLGVLEAKANFDGEMQEVHLRIAEHEGKVYLDLGRDDWKAVEVSAEGWRIVSDYPVRFRRVDPLLPLPMPHEGGNLAELRDLLNMDEDGWILAIAWLLFSFYPKYPHPILVFHGEQGTGKSFTAQILKSLVDPGKAPLIPKIADLRNLAITAENRWVLVYDNLSSLSADQSDALCRISTGGGFSTRTLYGYTEETVFEFIRPQMITGIDEIASRGDLLERSLMVELMTIPEDERLTEAELEERLELLRSRIFGALLMALSQTLKQLPSVEPDILPRMADFARFAIAAETALDMPEGSFMRVYAGNRESAHVTAVESSPVAVAIMRLMQSRESWQGTPSELLEALNLLVDDATRKKRNWSGTPKALGKALKRLAPDLRGVGIDIVRPERSSRKRWIRLEKMAEQTSQTSQTSEPKQDGDDSDDVSDRANVTTDGSNVTTDGSNVTDDVSTSRSHPTSSNVTANVTTETAVNQGFQACRDKSDVYDKSQAAFSNWVGQTVGKRGKRGWRGTVEWLEGTLAEVHWQGDPSPSWVSLDELEIVERAS